jgi:4-alpha-glucanotransferase
VDDGATQEPGPDDDLTRLADAYGVATDYWDWQGNHVTVPRSTVLAVLAALEVDASTDEALASALRDAELRPWRPTSRRSR